MNSRQVPNDETLARYDFWNAEPAIEIGIAYPTQLTKAPFATRFLVRVMEVSISEEGGYLCLDGFSVSEQSSARFKADDRRSFLVDGVVEAWCPKTGEMIADVRAWLFSEALSSNLTPSKFPDDSC